MIKQFKVIPRQQNQIDFSFGNIASSYGANGLYFTKDGQPFIPICGEFHFSRYDSCDWQRELLKMKANGLNSVATYLFWIHHEEQEGVFNFAGNRDIKLFLSICKSIDMPCVMRLGPWAHGECKWGGFPKHVQKLLSKRNDSPKYMQAVEKYWTRLYDEIKDYCDGSTVLGIQLENEYTGSIAHIHTLRKLAIKIGYKTPFFTMTAWPTNTPDAEMLPLFGGYPEAPWTFHKKPLSPAGRFAICHGRSEVEIGEDLIKGKREKTSFDDFPYAGCEVGVGNQVTQHRRPNMNNNDGYGVAFAKFASGMNWMGYYMYHGGRNPLGGLYQESRRTLYPNNYPIIDYDFQAPISKDGEYRPWAHSLRLLHYFITFCDKDLACKSAYFADTTSGIDDIYCSVRCDENLSGYLFVSNYERGRASKDYKAVDFNVTCKDKALKLPTLDVPKDCMFILPFNYCIGNVVADYVTAQPIAKIDNTHYFMQYDFIPSTVSVGGKQEQLKDNMTIGGVTIKLLTRQEAMDFYIIDNSVRFCNFPIFKQGSALYVEDSQMIENSHFKLKEVAKVKLPHDYYLYSHGARRFYQLKLDKDLINHSEDAIIDFEFKGLNLQVFYDGQLVDDWFNINGNFSFHTRVIKSMLNDCDEVIIKLANANTYGVGNVYHECDSVVAPTELLLKTVRRMKVRQLNK